jgi:hypothetical protein
MMSLLAVDDRDDRSVPAASAPSAALTLDPWRHED